MKHESSQKKTDLMSKVRRTLRAALCVLLCITTTGCTTILGDGEITVVTAPPIVTPRVIVVDTYGKGDADRFNIPGTDAFYLLPGIENNPDELQDFSCLDYTDEGYFVYYYCGPAYINANEVYAYKGTSGVRPQSKYEVLTGKKSECDAMVVMAYKPETGEYYVMDAQAYSKETANSTTGGEANTGVDFYLSPIWGFYTLSHCYGCKIAGMHRYFIFDQNGQASVYDDSFKCLSVSPVAGLIGSRVDDLENQLNGGTGSSNAAGSKTGGSGDSGFSSDDDSDEAKEAREEAKREVAEVTGHTYEEEESDRIELNWLVKSAIMDGSNIMYFSLLVYEGDTPWTSPTLLDRVVQVYSFDLSGDQIKFISKNANYWKQVAEYESLVEQGADITIEDIKKGKFNPDPRGIDPVAAAVSPATYADAFTAFGSDIENFPAYIAGYGDLYANGGRGFRAIISGAAADKDCGLGDAAYMTAFYGSWFTWLFGRREALANTIKSVMENTGFTGPELKYLFTLFYETGVYSSISGWDWILSLAGMRDIRNYFYGIYNLASINKPLSSNVLNDVKSFWNNISENKRLIMKQCLLSYYNQSASTFLKWAQGKSGSLTWTGYLAFLEQFDLMIQPKGYNSGTKRNTVDIPTDASFSRQYDQALLMVHGTNVDFSKMESLPHCSVITMPELGTGAWVEPYEWNQEIKVEIRTPGGWTANEEAAKAAWDKVIETADDPLTIQDQLNYEKQIGITEYPAGNEALNRLTAYLMKNDPMIFPDGDSTPEKRYQIAQIMYHAAHGYIKESDKVDTSHSIPANSFPISYRLCFPKGTTVQYVNMDNVSGSTTASVTTGALLFADNATQTKEGLEYTSSIRWVRENETGAQQELPLYDTGVEGAAIDSGALEYSKVTTFEGRKDKVEQKEKRMMPILITEKGVKFYSAYKKDGTAVSKPVYVRNENLLTSTGFTPYTESEMQGSIAARLGEGEKGRYDDKIQLSSTEKDLSQTLNSSRIGTIQSALSFTMLSDDETLISTYDAGLVLVKLPREEETAGDSGQDERLTHMQLQTGSYYQSFPNKDTGNYKIVGYDTEEYMYGSMDLARAKVYDFNVSGRRDEMYLSALKGHLKQYGVDYVRRLNRTRTEFTETGASSSDVVDGETAESTKSSITEQKTVIVDFDEDHGEEAEVERLLFEKSGSEAVEELKKQEAAIGMSHMTEAEDYLKELRESIKDQQKALDEVIELTGASRLGDDKKKKDPYFVGIKERLQATTELGNLKDLMVEVAISDEVIKTMDAPDQKIYKELKKTLDYRGEAQERNENMAETAISAEDLEKMLNDRKTADDYEEQYDEVTRRENEVPDPLEDKLKTDVFTDRVETKDDTDARAGVREQILGDIENNYFKAHPLAPEKVYAPDGTYEEIVTTEREDEAWNDYLEKLLNRINPDNLAAKREAVLEDEKKKEIANKGTTAANAMAQLVEFICEGAGEVSKEDKISMVEDLLIGMETLTGSQMAEEAVLIERMTLPAFQAYKSAYDAFNRTDYENGGDTDDGFVLSSGAAIRLAKYKEQDFYRKVIVTMQESALVKEYLKENGQSWDQYMASLPITVQGEAENNDEWDPEKEAKAVYDTFEPFAPISEESRPESSAGDEERPTIENYQ